MISGLYGHTYNTLPPPSAYTGSGWERITLSKKSRDKQDRATHLKGSNEANFRKKRYL